MKTFGFRIGFRKKMPSKVVFCYNLNMMSFFLVGKRERIL